MFRIRFLKGDKNPEDSYEFPDDRFVYSLIFLLRFNDCIFALLLDMAFLDHILNSCSKIHLDLERVLQNLSFSSVRLNLYAFNVTNAINGGADKCNACPLGVGKGAGYGHSFQFINYCTV